MRNPCNRLPCSYLKNKTKVAPSLLSHLTAGRVRHSASLSVGIGPRLTPHLGLPKSSKFALRGTRY